MQTGLTAVAPQVSSPTQFFLWIVACSLALGVGVVISYLFYIHILTIMV
jgi:hypothetical protein